MPIARPFPNPEQEARRQANAVEAATIDEAMRTWIAGFDRKLREALRNTDNPDEAGWRAFAAMTSPQPRE